MDGGEDRQAHGYLYDFKNDAWTMIYNRMHASNEMSNFIYTKDNELMWHSANSALANDARFYKWTNNPISPFGQMTIGAEDLTDKINNLKQFRITTKDFTFEEPAVRKKIYKVYVTYKSVDKVGTDDEASANSNVLLYYATNGQGASDGTTNWTEFPDSTEAGGATTYYKTSGSYAAGSAGFQGVDTWKTVELKPSSSINNIYSFQLKFEWDKQDNIDGQTGNFSNDAIIPNGFMINDISIVYRKKSIK